MCQFVGWQCVAGGAVGGGRHLDGPPHGEQTPGQSLVGLNQAFCSQWEDLLRHCHAHREFRQDLMCRMLACRTQRRHRSTLVVEAELVVQLINLIAFLIPNAVPVAHVLCEDPLFHRVLAACVIIRWTCWNTVGRHSLIQYGLASQEVQKVLLH